MIEERCTAVFLGDQIDKRDDKSHRFTLKDQIYLRTRIMERFRGGLLFEQIKHTEHHPNHPYRKYEISVIVIVDVYECLYLVEHILLIL